MLPEPNDDTPEPSKHDIRIAVLLIVVFGLSIAGILWAGWVLLL